MAQHEKQLWLTHQTLEEDSHSSEHSVPHQAVTLKQAIDNYNNNSVDVDHEFLFEDALENQPERGQFPKSLRINEALSQQDEEEKEFEERLKQLRETAETAGRLFAERIRKNRADMEAQLDDNREDALREVAEILRDCPASQASQKETGGAPFSREVPQAKEQPVRTLPSRVPQILGVPQGTVLGARASESPIQRSDTFAWRQPPQIREQAQPRVTSVQQQGRSNPDLRLGDEQVPVQPKQTVPGGRAQNVVRVQEEQPNPLHGHLLGGESTPLAYLNQQSGPVQNQSRFQEPSHHRIPPIEQVRKWNCKFGGEANECLITFLERIEELRFAYGFTDKDMMTTIPEIVKGKVLLYYRNNSESIGSWSEFVHYLKVAYLSTDYDDDLEVEIISRTQGPNESITDYVTKLSTLIRRSQRPLPPLQMLNRIYKNMLPSYKNYMKRAEVDCIETLLFMGQEYERINRDPSTQSKSLFPETAVESSDKSASKVKPSSGQNNRPNYNQRGTFNSPNYNSRGQRSGAQPVTSQLHYNMHVNAVGAEAGRGFRGRGFRGAYRGGASHAAPGPSVTCWNCKSTGHRFQECDQEVTRRFCYGCGQDGVTKPNCPRCEFRAQQREFRDTLEDNRGFPSFQGPRGGHFSGASRQNHQSGNGERGGEGADPPE
jgi:hypothetical protein